MGLFGIKKANEDTKPSNTFINENVINAADYSNMPVNTVVGYNQPTDVSNPDVMNYDANSNNGETFVYSQVSNNDYNNQFVSADLNQNVDQSTMYNNQMMNQVDSNMYSSEPTSDVVVTVDNNFNQVDNSNYDVNQEFSGMNNVPFDNTSAMSYSPFNPFNTFFIAASSAFPGAPSKSARGAGAELPIRDLSVVALFLMESSSSPLRKSTAS